MRIDPSTASSSKDFLAVSSLLVLRPFGFFSAKTPCHSRLLREIPEPVIAAIKHPFPRFSFPFFFSRYPQCPSHVYPLPCFLSRILGDLVESVSQHSHLPFFYAGVFFSPKLWFLRVFVCSPLRELPVSHWDQFPYRSLKINYFLYCTGILQGSFACHLFSRFSLLYVSRVKRAQIINCWLPVSCGFPPRFFMGWAYNSRPFHSFDCSYCPLPLVDRDCVTTSSIRQNQLSLHASSVA